MLTITILKFEDEVGMFKTIDLNQVIRFFTLCTFVVGIMALYDTGEPRPFYLSVLNGLAMSFILNLGLLLTSFDILRKKLKYILILWMIPSMLGVSFVWADLYIYLGPVGIISHLYIIYTLFKGDSNEIAYNIP